MQVQLPKLNFPVSTFNLKEVDGRLFIFDQSRRKFVNLTPEEWVRQNCLVFLRDQKGFPMSLLAVEKSFRLNGKLLRYDIVAYSKNASPVLLVECKAPEVKISQKTFDQIAVYNLELKVPYLMVTNGLDHYCCVIDVENSRFHFLREIPDFENL